MRFLRSVLSAGLHGTGGQATTTAHNLSQNLRWDRLSFSC